MRTYTHRPRRDRFEDETAVKSDIKIKTRFTRPYETGWSETTRARAVVRFTRGPEWIASESERGKRVREKGGRVAGRCEVVEARERKCADKKEKREW